MMSSTLPPLCGHEGCRKLKGHKRAHEQFPSEAWAFLKDKDLNKLAKAGFATPRGGQKGAYQNHVDRSNKVIIPFEFLHRVDLNQYKDGYVVRLFPDQYFESANRPKAEFMATDSQ